MANFTISSLVTVPQVLLNGQTGRVSASGDLVTQGTPAVTGSGRFTLSVAGQISATGADAIRATTATSATITVAEGGSVTATRGDALDLIANGTVTLDNSGTIDGDIVITTTGRGKVALVNSGTVNGDILVTNDVTDILDLRNGFVTGTVSGGKGNDDYYIDSIDVRLFEAADGGTADRIFTTVSFIAPLDFEVINLLGTATISVTATDPDGVRILGNTARNTLSGGAGNDWLHSNRGGDHLIGGAGDDNYHVYPDDIIVERANGGIDTIRLPGGYLEVDTYTLPAHVENLVNGSTGDLTLNGNALNNSLSFNAFASPDLTFNGGGGIDTMIGGRGDDTYITDGGDTITESADSGTDTVLTSVTLTLGNHLEKLTLTDRSNTSGAGNGENNTITGNSGHNSLYGHGGADTMTGGAGKDSFVFSASMRNSNIDTITDFNVNDDTIRLSSAVFGALPDGTLSAAAFARNATGQATEANDRIIYETDTGRLFYDSDGTGSAPRGHFATLASGLSLTAADFFVL
jgi:Ca2+-binding RTX toxin-like protein